MPSRYRTKVTSLGVIEVQYSFSLTSVFGLYQLLMEIFVANKYTTLFTSLLVLLFGAEHETYIGFLEHFF